MRMKMIVAVAAGCLVAAAGLAQAQEQADPLAGFYGNTLRIEAKGFKDLRFFEPDHTFRNRVKDKVLTGTWWIEGDRICVQQAAAAKFCNVGLGKTPGQAWVDHDPYTGNEVKFALVEGRKADR